MGYILPITHHTYKNYQYRMGDKKDSPHFIRPTYRVVFHKISEEHECKEKPNNSEEKSIKKSMQKQGDFPAYKINATQNAKLTGKGGQFNETV